MHIELFELMKTGGPLMWVIFIIAFTAFSLVVWQTLILVKNLRLSYEDYRWIQGNEDIFVTGNGESTSPIRLLIKNIEKCRFKDKEEIVGAINIRADN